MIEGIVNAIKTIPRQKVYYTSAEKFVIDRCAVQIKTMNSFKDRYRHFDVLIMDDIQMIGRGKRFKMNYSIF